VATLRVLTDPTPSDVDAVRALEARAAAADGHESLGAAAARDLAHPGPASFGVAATADGAVVGYAHAALADSQEDPHLELATVVDPRAPDRAGLVAALLGATTDELARRGERGATLWVPGAAATTDTTLRGLGWEPARDQHRMEIALPRPDPITWPPGVEVAPFRPGRDEAAWVAVNNRAFAGHPEQGGWTEATLARRTAEPGFDPADLLLAWDAEGLAGFDWTKVHREGPDAARGEISVIGVDPGRQGTGLGRALVLAGLDHLARDHGCSAALLYVAAASGAAVGLYRALGFTVTRTDRAYTWP
jgi:mycothiol synthase